METNPPNVDQEAPTDDSPGVLATEPVSPTDSGAPLWPFLPDTNIQYAWDSTSLEKIKRCPRLYYYEMIEGWQPKGEAIHLRWGIEYHQAMHDYETYKTLNLNHHDAVHATLKDLLVRIESWDPEPRTPGEEKKSKANLVRAVVWYLDKYEHDPAATLFLDNGKPALELSFKIELDVAPEPWTQPYLLCGHLDRAVAYQGSTFVMDRKTTSFSIGKYYFDSWDPHNQMSLYTIAGKIVLHSPIRGVIIDAVKVDEIPEFGRGITYRSQDRLDEWLHELTWVFKEAEDYAGENYWPMRDTSCSMYGGCKFREICSKSPAARERFLNSGFNKLEKEDRWNPLKPR